MKILLAASIYPPDPGGPALHAKRFHEWLDQQVVENEVVILSKYCLLPKGLRHLVYIWKLWKRAKGASIIYAYDALGAGLPALLIAKLRRKKLIIRIGGDIPWERAADEGLTDLSMNEWYTAGEHKKNFNFKLSRFVMRRATALITHSYFLSNLFINRYEVLKERITVIPNPLPTRIRKNGEYKKPRTIIFASRLVTYKNLAFVLDAFSRFLPSYPDVKFIIMGDGPERERLEARTRAFDLEQQVTFTGSISQKKVIEETSACYVGLAPALTEFNPNYILECLSFGKPFLISNENGLPFKVSEIFLFDPRSQTQFEEKLRYLLSAEGYQEALEEVREIDFRMSWEEVLEKNLELLESL